jgi:hypothetical protein
MGDKRDGHLVVRTFEYLDPIPRGDHPRLDDCQVGARPSRPGEFSRQQRIGVAESELEAGQPGLAHFEDRAADRPALADAGRVDVGVPEREVLAERPRAK